MSEMFNVEIKWNESDMVSRAFNMSLRLHFDVTF